MKKIILLIVLLFLPSFASAVYWYDSGPREADGDNYRGRLEIPRLAPVAWLDHYNFGGVMPSVTSAFKGIDGTCALNRRTLPADVYVGRSDFACSSDYYYRLEYDGGYFQVQRSSDYVPPDTDGDGVADSSDLCPDTPESFPVDSDGCPTEPATCTDHLLTTGEDGIDCGGICSAICELLCPDGFEPLTGVGEVWEGKCYGGIFSVNSLGDCPPNTVAGTGEDTVGCVGIEEPFLVSTAFLPADITTMGIPPIDYSFQGDTYDFTQDSTFTTEDNGDGTSTETTVTTSASGEGTDSSSETTTRVDVIDNSTSSILSSSITTVVNESANESLETFGFDQGIPDNVYDSDITADLPDVLEIDADGGFLDSFISNSSFFTVLNSGQINTSNPVCSLTTPAIFQNDANPSGFTIDFDLCPWESHLQTVGALLLIICQFYALFIVYRGWRA